MLQGQTAADGLARRLDGELRRVGLSNSVSLEPRAISILGLTVRTAVVDACGIVGIVCHGSRPVRAATAKSTGSTENILHFSVGGFWVPSS